MNNIALYSSTMGAGKTTVANYLVENYGYERLKFARILKDMLFVFLESFVDDPWEYIEGDKKEDVIPDLGVTCRYLMQTLGTEWGRMQVGLDTWVIATLNKLNPNQRYIIDDMRFPNEYKALKDKGFVLIKLVGYGELTQKHASEGSLDDFTFDYVIQNNGTLENLLDKIDLILEDME